MGEIIYKIVKLITAISLQILSFSLIIWVLNLKPHFSFKHIAYAIFISILVYFFVSYSLSLFKQAFTYKQKKQTSEILDEDEINKHQHHD
jgi:TRAP-type C4-dicarboxylate transport system permease small subunit